MVKEYLTGCDIHGYSHVSHLLVQSYFLSFVTAMLLIFWYSHASYLLVQSCFLSFGTVMFLIFWYSHASYLLVQSCSSFFLKGQSNIAFWFLYIDIEVLVQNYSSVLHWQIMKLTMHYQVQMIQISNHDKSHESRWRLLTNNLFSSTCWITGNSKTLYWEMEEMKFDTPAKLKSLAKR